MCAHSSVMGSFCITGDFDYMARVAVIPDTKSGYARVSKPMYGAENVLLILGEGSISTPLRNVKT